MVCPSPEKGSVGLEPGLREEVWQWGVMSQALIRLKGSGCDQSDILCLEAGQQWSRKLRNDSCLVDP